MATSLEEDRTVNRHSTVVNWGLALSTLLGAAAVVAYAFMQVLATAACSSGTCPKLGPGEIGFTLIVYGVPTVAVLTVLLSFVTARRRRGIVLPIVTWLVIAVAAVVLYATFP
jgi:ABC-type branched-subunit amino acid transport system permease subunit